MVWSFLPCKEFYILQLWNICDFILIFLAFSWFDVHKMLSCSMCMYACMHVYRPGLFLSTWIATDVNTNSTSLFKANINLFQKKGSKGSTKLWWRNLLMKQKFTKRLTLWGGYFLFTFLLFFRFKVNQTKVQKHCWTYVLHVLSWLT